MRSVIVGCFLVCTFARADAATPAAFFAATGFLAGVAFLGAGFFPAGGLTMAASVRDGVMGVEPYAGASASPPVVPVPSSAPDAGGAAVLSGG